jgi:hypothetical protein
VYGSHYLRLQLHPTFYPPKRPSKLATIKTPKIQL